MSEKPNPPAFPREDYQCDYAPGQRGMTLRDWFAGHALANAPACTGSASDWQLNAWFGKTRTGISRDEIMAAQAYALADAMLAARLAGERP